MIPEAETWVEHDINLKGPLAGIPVSLKDSIAVGGFDVSVGYSCNTGKPYSKDGSVARLLKDAGKFMLIKPHSVACAHITRCRTIRQDQPSRNSSILRVNKRRMGTVYKSTQLEILSRRLDWWGECFISIRRWSHWYWLGRGRLCSSTSSFQRHILASLLDGQMAEDGNEYQHAWPGRHPQRLQSHGTNAW